MGEVILYLLEGSFVSSVSWSVFGFSLQRILTNHTMNTRNQIASNRRPNVQGFPGSFDQISPFKGYSIDARGHRVNKIKIKHPTKKFKKQKKKSYIYIDLTKLRESRHRSRYQWQPSVTVLIVRSIAYICPNPLLVSLTSGSLVIFWCVLKCKFIPSTFTRIYYHHVPYFVVMIIYL